MYDNYLQQFLTLIEPYLSYLSQDMMLKDCLLVTGFLLLILIASRLKNSKKTQSAHMKNTMRTVTNQHLDSIAGDDVLTTQLDLARAYIEMGEKKLAIAILKQVTEEGNPLQQRQAEQLMTGL